MSVAALSLTLYENVEQKTAPVKTHFGSVRDEAIPALSQQACDTVRLGAFLLTNDFHHTK